VIGGAGIACFADFHVKAGKAVDVFNRTSNPTYGSEIKGRPS
jgi:hypothetical protein